MPVAETIKENLFSKSLLRRKEPEIEENAGNGLGVTKFPAADHLLQLLAIMGTGNYFLILFRFCFARGQAFGKEDEHAFFEETRSRKNVQEDTKTLCAITRFLDKFAGRGCFWRFATSSRAPVLFACGDGVRLYSAFGISVEGAGL